MTGVYDYGVSVHEAATVNGIDFSRMNLDLEDNRNNRVYGTCLQSVWVIGSSRLHNYC